MSKLSLDLDTPELANHYEKASVARQFVAGRALVAKLGVREGERVLDVGSGTGLLAEHVAKLVGPSGSVLGIDPLPLRIDIARRKARSNLVFQVGDAYALGHLASETFDVVYLNAVFHWLPEKVAPLRTFHRLLAPGGRLGISTGSREHPNTVRSVRTQVLARTPYNAYPELRGQLGHQVTASELRDLLVHAGFAIRSIELEPHSNHHPTAEAAIEFTQASSFGNFLGHLPQTLRPSARREIHEELERLRTPQGIPHESRRIVAVSAKESS